MDTYDGGALRLWPYLRGYMPRDTLGQLWAAVEAAGDWGRLFWWREEEGQTPFPTQGDLVDFMEFFTDPEDPKILLIGEAMNSLVGACWFYLRQPDGSCEGGTWIAPEWRGVFSREMVNRSLAFIQEVHDIRSVNATTPWPDARNLCLKCGFQLLQSIKQADGRVLYQLRKELTHGQRRRQGPKDSPIPSGS